MMNSKKTGLIALTIVIIVALVASFSWLKFSDKGLPDGLIQANGRIEGEHYTVAGKMPGKVIEISVREGDTVTKGQVLARMDGTQVQAKVDQTKAAVDALSAQLAGARIGLETLKKQIPLQVDTAIAGVAHADATLAAAKAGVEQAGRDARRLKNLLNKGTVEKHSAEQADLAWKVSRAEYATAMAALTQAKKQLAEVKLGTEQVEARAYQVRALESQLTNARAALAEAQSLLDDLTLHAPAGGIVTTRIINEGEVVAAGSPLLDIVDLDRLYLKVYIPGKQIGKIRLGLPAQIYSDAYPDKPYAATVRYIASQAEFTPKEVQTPDERVKLVYAVKLYLDANPQHQLTPGLPADAVIRWKEDTPWAKPRW
jgi:HlyD family secretion protein